MVFIQTEVIQTLLCDKEMLIHKTIIKGNTQTKSKKIIMLTVALQDELTLQHITKLLMGSWGFPLPHTSVPWWPDSGPVYIWLFTHRHTSACTGCVLSWGQGGFKLWSCIHDIPPSLKSWQPLLSVHERVNVKLFFCLLWLCIFRPHWQAVIIKSSSSSYDDDFIVIAL